MRARSRFAATAALLIGSAVGWSAPAGAKTKIIYSLPAGSGGGSVNATDAAGNLYGVTFGGGLLSKCLNQGCGTIFELMPPAAAGSPWTEQTLYAFPDGASGYISVGYPGGLMRDAAGNLYGAALGGKIGGETGGGVIWELSPPAVSGATWTFHVLYTFSHRPGRVRGGPDGGFPCSTLVQDSTGTLYGTTIYGGASDGGVVFSLAPPPPGGLAWTETVLHSFPKDANGYVVHPNCPLTLSAGGRVLYGTTGGTIATYQGGLVFRLRRQPGGWVYRPIFDFSGSDGYGPNGGLVVDRNGNLFGTLGAGGSDNDGGVFELSPPSAGQTAWTEQLLHSFDGSQPTGGLAVARGVTALFGTTAGFEGPIHSGEAVFRLDPPASGSGPWSYTLLHRFGSPTPVPSYSNAPIFGHTHRLFGTINYGGTNGAGAVFSQTPDFPPTAK